MTADKEWLAQQPPCPAPCTPRTSNETQRPRLCRRSWEADEVLEEEEPASTEAEAASPASEVAAPPAAAPTAAATQAAAVAAAAERLALPKHLVFPCPAAEADFRACLGRSCWLGELGLLGLQLVGFVAAAGRAVEMRCWRILWRTVLLLLLPSLAHLYLLACRTGAYHRRRERFSVALRTPFNAWLLFTQDAPDLSIAHRLPRTSKLLLIAFFELVMAPQLVCLPWLWSFGYSTALLAMWLHQHGAAGALVVAALLAAYAAPLACLYHKEAAQRTAWALRRLGHGPGGAHDDAGIAAPLARRLRARVDADPFAPLDMLLPAAIAVCRACLL